MRASQTGKCIVVVLISAFAIGCGGSRRVPVEGVVTLDGKPLAKAKVMLQRPDGPLDERFFSGETNEEGRYAMGTPETGEVGAPEGDYRVLITSVQVPPDANEMTPLPKERVPPSYRNGSQTITVPAGGTTTADFAIKTK